MSAAAVLSPERVRRAGERLAAEFTAVLEELFQPVRRPEDVTESAPALLAPGLLLDWTDRPAEARLVWEAIRHADAAHADASVVLVCGVAVPGWNLPAGSVPVIAVRRRGRLRVDFRRLAGRPGVVAVAMTGKAAVFASRAAALEHCPAAVIGTNP
jgi:hypothetical protein